MQTTSTQQNTLLDKDIVKSMDGPFAHMTSVWRSEIKKIFEDSYNKSPTDRELTFLIKLTRGGNPFDRQPWQHFDLLDIMEHNPVYIKRGNCPMGHWVLKEKVYATDEDIIRPCRTCTQKGEKRKVVFKSELFADRVIFDGEPVRGTFASLDTPTKKY